jgi:hypothetical protein
MDLYTVGMIVAMVVAFWIGLMIDVDEFAGGVFSKLKGKKDQK